MSKRGKNKVKRSIMQGAAAAFDSWQDAPKTPKTFNPLFGYLQSMFPNYDNAVLHAVLCEQDNSVEKAIEVLLTFAVDNTPAAPATAVQDFPDFSDDGEDVDTPPNVFTLPVMPPVSSQNSGRDHVSLYEYQMRGSAGSKKSQRRKRAALRAKKQAAAQSNKRKVKWVPMNDFIVGTTNPYEVLGDVDGDDKDLQQILLMTTEKAADPADVEEEAQALLLNNEEIEECWKEFESATEVEAEEAPQVSDGDWVYSVVNSTTTTTTSSSLDLSPPATSDDDFVVVSNEKEAPLTADVAASAKVTVKLYYSASDIHRLGMSRDSLAFAKLYQHAAAYLHAKCQPVLAKTSATACAFALTYVDDEGDVIHLCSDEELAEAIRLHEDVFWAGGKQPILRLHIKPLEGAVHDGHISVTSTPA